MLIVVGKSMSRFWQCVGLSGGGVSMWLWASCCNARAVHTASRTRAGCWIAGASWSKLVLAVWSRRVERAGWLRLNRFLVLRTKWTDKETVAKVCHALAHTRSSERIGEARALSCPELCGRIWDDSFAVPKLCERIGDGSYGFAVPKLALSNEQARSILVSAQIGEW